MTGSSKAYKEACNELRTNLVKGRQFKDSQNRQITILDVPKQKSNAIEVEVTTLLNKPDEKRGKARINMLQPKAKGPTKIVANMPSGSDYLFAKVLMTLY